MKKIFSLLLALCLLLALPACGQSMPSDPRALPCGTGLAAAPSAVCLSPRLPGEGRPAFRCESPAGSRILTEPGDAVDPSLAPVVGEWRHESGYTYHFEADGTGSYTKDGQAMNFRYEVKGDTLSILFDGSTLPMEVKFRVEGDTLIIIDHFGKEVPYERYVAEPVLHALESLPVYDADQAMAMNNWINLGPMLVEDDVFYGSYYLESSFESFLVTFEILHEGNDLKAGPWTFLDAEHHANYLQKRGDLLYYVALGMKDSSEPSGIVSVRTDGSDRKVLVEGPCESLFLAGERMFFTDGEARLYSADLNGEDPQLILDKEVYYTYFLNEDWLLYQDDADSESLHLYYLPKQYDLKLNDERSFNPVLLGSRLFYTTPDGDAFHLSCIDLSSWETVKDPRLGCLVPVFAPEHSELLMGSIFSTDGTYLLPSNNYNGKEPEYWMDLEDNAYQGYTRYYIYHSADYEIEYKLKGDSISAIMFRDRNSVYSNAIPWLS